MGDMKDRLNKRREDLKDYLETIEEGIRKPLKKMKIWILLIIPYDRYSPLSTTFINLQAFLQRPGTPWPILDWSFPFGAVSQSQVGCPLCHDRAAFQSVCRLFLESRQTFWLAVFLLETRQALGLFVLFAFTSDVLSDFLFLIHFVDCPVSWHYLIRQLKLLCFALKAAQTIYKSCFDIGGLNGWIYFPTHFLLDVLDFPSDQIYLPMQRLFLLSFFN